MLVVDISEFFGSWLMNHDGLTGKLMLEGVRDPEDAEDGISINIDIPDSALKAAGLDRLETAASINITIPQDPEAAATAEIVDEAL